MAALELSRSPACLGIPRCLFGHCDPAYSQQNVYHSQLLPSMSQLPEIIIESPKVPTNLQLEKVVEVPQTQNVDLVTQVLMFRGMLSFI